MGYVKLALVNFVDYSFAMQLGKYLQVRKISSRKFAMMVGASVPAVRKWRQRARLPKPRNILRIQKATNNQVKPKDWYS